MVTIVDLYSFFRLQFSVEFSRKYICEAKI